LTWAKDLFCAYANSDRKNMTIDEDGNIYIIAQNYQEFSGKPIGIYVDNVLIHSGLGVSDFVLKFDTNGKLLWFKKRLTNSLSNAFLSIEAKGKNVYITGKNTSSSFFDTKSVPEGLFVIKLDDSGNTLWAKKIGNDIVVEKVSSTFDNAGNLIVLDDRNGLSKVKSEDGAVVWTKKGPLSINSKMTAQNDGSVFILTDFAGSISLDNRKVTTTKAKGLALIGLDANGTVIQATVLSQDATFLPLALTSDENGFLKAIYYKEKEGSGTLQYPSWNVNNKRSIVAQQFTSSGLELAQKEIFTRLEYPTSLRATFDKNEDFVFTGQNVQYVDTIPNIPLSYGYYHILARFSFKGKLAEPSDNIIKLGDITLSPNPVSNLLTLSSDDIDFRDANVLIYNLLGQIQGITVNENNPRVKRINVSNLIKGMYILVIQRGNEILTKKFTKF
jgi:Secretion system C-terminal sorting domain